MKAMLQACRCSVPDGFLELFEQSGAGPVLPGDTASGEMTVMSVTVRGLAALAEQLTPEQTLRGLNDVMRDVGESVQAQGGFIDRYVNVAEG